MLTYAVYSEGGGVGKTIISANLARAHAEHRHRTLVLDLDPQEGSLSHLFGVDHNRADGDADNLAYHMAGRPQGDFADLVETAEGIDIIPSHNKLERLPDLLSRAKQHFEGTGGTFNKYTRLQEVLADAGVPDRYDVLVIDPPATLGAHVYNAINATHNVVSPVELSGKGAGSMSGLEDATEGIKAELGVETGVLAVVPNRFEGTNSQKRMLAEIQEAGGDYAEYASPVTLRKRSALFGGCWDERCSAFAYLNDHRERPPEREKQTVEKFDRLARHLEQQSDITDTDAGVQLA